MINELRRIVEDSEIMAEDDALWPQPDRVGRQELEIVIGDEHISFTTSKIGSQSSLLIRPTVISTIMPLLSKPSTLTLAQ